MVDALPYLVGYPYGCTEQTLSRFLPTVITQKVLQQLDIDLEAVRQKSANLNAQEAGDPAERAKQWQVDERNPVFDEKAVLLMAKQGLARLAAMQVDDGGWGWFSGANETSQAHTTAHVVRGLLVARELGLHVDQASLTRGIQWLERYQVERLQVLDKEGAAKDRLQAKATNLDALVYRVLALAGQHSPSMGEYLYRDRTGLSIYGNTLFALVLEQTGQKEKLDEVLRFIEQYLVMDEENETAYLNLPNDTYWWVWYGSETEAHAYYLKLLTKIAPAGKKAAWLVKYLLNNRKHASYWNATRDTAIMVEAFADYLTRAQELSPDMHIEIWLDNVLKKQVAINRENLFTFDGVLRLEGDALVTGKHRLTIKKQGNGPLYYHASLDYFSLEDHITSAGLDLRVERNYFKLRRREASQIGAGAKGQVVEQALEKYDRIALTHLDEVESGDLIEVELTVHSKNDYEYLIFEDRKAAGFEPVDSQSGYNGNALGAYVEYRDESVNFFVRRLARGTHSVSYRLRAEIPGIFSALPTRVYAMYAPELMGNSEEIRLEIDD
ncbi:MAG: alpha-2-macroglobulin, partial [Gammaproteobacteria bacterium]|nr:alpha-2-macroglobulin [Gammaproteobacteria bacterium]